MLSLLSTSAKVSVDDNFSLLQTVNYYTVEPQNVRSQEVVSTKVRLLRSLRREVQTHLLFQ